jgi:small subunit ribosomal protein S1
VELGEGVQATCRIAGESAPAEEKPAGSADISSLTSMLQAKWKSGQGSGSKKEGPRAGQVRSFRITRLDAGTKKIEVEIA